MSDSESFEDFFETNFNIEYIADGDWNKVTFCDQEFGMSYSPDYEIENFRRICEITWNARGEIEQKKIDELEETHRLQLAGIMTVAYCNTRESLDNQMVNRDSPYWTVAYDDVLQAREREIALIEKLQAAEEKLKGEQRASTNLMKHLNDERLRHGETERKLQAAEERERILREAVEFYADPYNYTPDLDAMYGKQLNMKAWQALEKIASNEAGKEQE